MTLTRDVAPCVGGGEMKDGWFAIVVAASSSPLAFENSSRSPTLQSATRLHEVPLAVTRLGRAHFVHLQVLGDLVALVVGSAQTKPPAAFR